MQHAVISFMPGILGTMAPFFPTKLYDDKRAKEKNDIVYMLPGALAACVSYNYGHDLFPKFICRELSLSSAP